MCEGLAFSFYNPWQGGSHFSNKSTQKCYLKLQKQNKVIGTIPNTNWLRRYFGNIWKTLLCVYTVGTQRASLFPDYFSEKNLLSFWNQKAKSFSSYHIASDSKSKRLFFSDLSPQLQWLCPCSGFQRVNDNLKRVSRCLLTRYTLLYIK